MNAKVLTKYRPDVDEYDCATVHSRISASRKTACGLDLQKVKVWEPTHYEPDCKKCIAALAKVQP